MHTRRWHVCSTDEVSVQTALRHVYNIGVLPVLINDCIRTILRDSTKTDGNQMWRMPVSHDNTLYPFCTRGLQSGIYFEKDKIRPTKYARVFPLIQTKCLTSARTKQISTYYVVTTLLCILKNQYGFVFLCWPHKSTARLFL